MLDLQYLSYYVMASCSKDDHRVSAYFDHIKTTERNRNALFVDNEYGNGNAITLAYSYSLLDGHRAMLEWLRIKSDRYNRPDIGREISAPESQIQLSYRIVF